MIARACSYDFHSRSSCSLAMKRIDFTRAIAFTSSPVHLYRMHFRLGSPRLFVYVLFANEGFPTSSENWSTSPPIPPPRSLVNGNFLLMSSCFKCTQFGTHFLAPPFRQLVSQKLEGRQQHKKKKRKKKKGGSKPDAPQMTTFCAQSSRYRFILYIPHYYILFSMYS